MTTVVSNKRKTFVHAWWKPLLLIATVGLLGLFALGLGRDPTFMPSALVGRAVPEFELATLSAAGKTRSGDLAGNPLIINFWASWCGACRSEHDTLLKLGRELQGAGQVRILGINHRDTGSNAERFLSSLGAFPYPSAIDADGRTGVDFGVFGLPETFFVDATGIVRARHIGPLNERDVSRYLAVIGVER